MKNPDNFSKDLDRLVDMEFNYPKAIELLKSTLDGNFLPEELQDEIEEFLNSLEDATNL